MNNEFRTIHSWQCATSSDPWPAPTAYERRRARHRATVLRWSVIVAGMAIIAAVMLRGGIL